MSAKSIHHEVTNSIVEILERGTLPWRCNWKTGGGTTSAVPCNAFTKRPYQGVNRIILWAAAYAQGYPSHDWATYRQIQDAGGHVRRGERGTHVVFYRPVQASNHTRSGGSHEVEEGSKQERTIWIMRAFTVFNVAQSEGPGEVSTPAEPSNAIPRAHQFIGNINAHVVHGGNRAFYSPTTDSIHLPLFDSFTTPEAYYATSLHEHIHFSGHSSRLDRLDKWAPFGSESYGYEELVAELGAAFLCADLDVRGELEHHASYLQCWLTALKRDSKALFAAAADAHRATEYLHSLQPAHAEQAA